VPEEIASEIGAFLDKFWGTDESKVYFAASFEHKQFRQFFNQWPLNRQKIVNAIIQQSALGWDVWFCPSPYNADAPKPEREYIKSVNCHWLDFDGNAPVDWEKRAKEVGVPEPSLVIQTSVTSHQQVYWFTDRAYGQEQLEHAETITRNLTAAFATDKSGWDLTQLLRIPGTLNYGWYRDGEHKPWFEGAPQEALVLKDQVELVPESTFSILTNAERQILTRINITEVPPIAQVLAFGNWTQEMYSWFSMTKDEASERSAYKRSGSLQALAYFGAEQGFTDEQIYSILDDADRRWDKYVNRAASGRDKIFRDTIARAREKFGYLTGDSLTLAGLVDKAQQIEPKFIYNLAEFMELDLQIDWLLEGLIPVAGLGMIIGQPNVGKSRFGIQLGMELAIGSQQIFHRQNSTGAKKVMVMSLEMGAQELNTFFADFLPTYKDFMPMLKSNFFVAPFGEPVYFDQPQGQQLMSNILQQYKPDILLVDSLQASFSTELTNELAVKRFFKYLTEIRKAYNCAVIFLHHERKKTSDRVGTYTPSDLSDMYGNQMLAANIQFALSLSEQGIYVKLDEVKNRLAKKVNDVPLISEGIRFIINDPQIIERRSSGNETNGGSRGTSLNF
jgi:archaellum biogenesis ATPase FlaH